MHHTLVSTLYASHSSLYQNKIQCPVFHRYKTCIDMYLRNKAGQYMRVYKFMDICVCMYNGNRSLCPVLNCHYTCIHTYVHKHIHTHILTSCVLQIYKSVCCACLTCDFCVFVYVWLAILNICIYICVEYEHCPVLYCHYTYIRTYIHKYIYTHILTGRVHQIYIYIYMY